MMKTLRLILVTLILGLSLTSCTIAAYPTTQDDIYTEVSVDEVNIAGTDMNVVIRYGTPYYYSGSLLYYLYNGIYYYPYYYDNYWYFRAYRRPFPYINYRPYFRPHRYDYRFHSGYVGHRSWHRNNTPHGNYNRPNRHHPRPDARPSIRRPDIRPNGRPSNPVRGGSTINRPSQSTRQGSSRGGSIRGGRGR